MGSKNCAIQCPGSDDTEDRALTSAREDLALEVIPVQAAQLFVTAEGDRAACWDLRASNRAISSLI